MKRIATSLVAGSYLQVSWQVLGHLPVEEAQHQLASPLEDGESVLQVPAHIHSTAGQVHLTACTPGLELAGGGAMPVWAAGNGD